MLYTKKQKEEIEKVLSVFGEYIKSSPYLDLVWSDKLGYILLQIELKYRNVFQDNIIENAEQLCAKLLEEVADDVLQMTGNEHSMQEADPLERAEIEKRLAVYAEKLPEYGYLVKRVLEELAKPQSYNEKCGKWVYSDLPILPDRGSIRYRLL